MKRKHLKTRTNRSPEIQRYKTNFYINYDTQLRKLFPEFFTVKQNFFY